MRFSLTSLTTGGKNHGFCRSRYTVQWGLIVVGGLGAVYGLHRLGLWLEKRGWLFYKHKKPTSSAATVRPPARHADMVKIAGSNPAVATSTPVAQLELPDCS